MEIPTIVPFVVEVQTPHRLVCHCCLTTTAAVLPEGVESSGYGLRLCSLERHDHVARQRRRG